MIEKIIDLLNKYIRKYEAKNGKVWLLSVYVDEKDINKAFEKDIKEMTFHTQRNEAMICNSNGFTDIESAIDRELYKTVIKYMRVSKAESIRDRIKIELQKG